MENRESYLVDVLNSVRENAESLTYEDLGGIAESIMERLSEDCPNYNLCTEKAFESYEPDHDEGRE